MRYVAIASRTVDPDVIVKAQSLVTVFRLNLWALLLFSFIVIYVGALLFHSFWIAGIFYLSKCAERFTEPGTPFRQTFARSMWAYICFVSDQKFDEPQENYKNDIVRKASLKSGARLFFALAAFHVMFTTKFYEVDINC
jgi:hypothetical protein